MKFHRKCGGIFSSFLREKTEINQYLRSKNKVGKSFLKKFKKVVDMSYTVCYINKAVAKTTATNLEN